MVLDLGELQSLVRMCDQKNGGGRGEMSNSDDVDELSASDESEPEERPSNTVFDPELDGDDDDDDDDEVRDVEISTPAAGHRAQCSFSLRGGNSAFSNRSHSIFECLDSVTRLASSPLNHDNVPDTVFARPLPPRSNRKTSQPASTCVTPAKKRAVPDYMVHPERWTHYSLEDVTETSDQGNNRAAHQFLSSLQQRKKQQENRSDSSCSNQQKMIFSRPSGLLKEEPADQLSAVAGKDKETRLSHLEDEDEDVEDEKEMAGGRRTGQRVEKTEEKDMRAAVIQPAEKKQVEKDKEEKLEEANPAFTSFRKTKRINYRKNSGREDN